MNSFDLADKATALRCDPIDLSRLMLQVEQTSSFTAKCYSRINPEPRFGESDVSLSPVDIIGRFNSGALAQLRCGELGRAEALCLRAIEICGAGIRTGAVVAWTEALFWPCVNMGRLAAERGDCETSLQIYQQLLTAATERQDIHVCGIAVPVSEACRRLEKNGYGPGQVFGNAPHTCLVDSVQCLLKAGQFHQALQWLKHAAAATGGINSDLWLELHMLALMGMGRFAEVISVCQTSDDMVPQSRPMAFLMLQAEAYASVGDRDQMLATVRTIDCLAGTVEQSRISHGSTTVWRPNYLRYRLALCLQLGGAVRQASRYARQMLEQDPHDHRMSVLALSLLALNSNPPQRACVKELLERATVVRHRFSQAVAYAALAFANPRESIRNLSIAHALAHTINSMDARRLCGYIETTSEIFRSPTVNRPPEEGVSRILAEAVDEEAATMFARLMAHDISEVLARARRAKSRPSV